MKNHLILLWPYCHHWLPVHYSVKGEKKSISNGERWGCPSLTDTLWAGIYMFLHRLLKCCLTSTETVRLLGMGNSGQPPQLSPSLWALYIFQCSTPIYTCWHLKYDPVNLKLGPSAEKWFAGSCPSIPEAGGGKVWCCNGTHWGCWSPSVFKQQKPCFLSSARTLWNTQTQSRFCMCNCLTVFTWICTPPPLSVSSTLFESWCVFKQQKLCCCLSSTWTLWNTQTQSRFCMCNCFAVSTWIHTPPPLSVSSTLISQVWSCQPCHIPFADMRRGEIYNRFLSPVNHDNHIGVIEERSATKVTWL